MARKPAVTAKTEIPPLFAFSITNPVEYLRRWWNAIVGNEGLKITLQIKPLTTIFIVTVVSGIGFGFGKSSFPEIVNSYISQMESAVSPTPVQEVEPSPDTWRETAFTGKLQSSQGKYYLVTTASEAITLKVPAAIDLTILIGKRIMAAGLYNKTARILMVTDATDMEILPAKPIAVPTPSNEIN